MPLLPRPVFLVLVSLGFLWFLWSAFFDHAMDSLDSPFTIEVAGVPIAKVVGDLKERTQAKTGPDGAVFTLKDRRLSSGEYVLGRFIAEDRSFLPKQVYWFTKSEAESQAQSVTAEKSGDSYKLSFSGGGLIAEGGNVLADLTGGDESKVVIKFLED